MSNTKPFISFEPIAAPMGWAVQAVRNGKRYTVATGLISPDPSIRWCEKHLNEVHQAIDKIEAQETAKALA